MMRLTKRLLLVAGLLSVGLLAVGIGYAAIPAANGTISGCYNASPHPSGQLRVIDKEAGAKCAKNEKPLDFNQIGPKGDKGDKGDQGIHGIQGTQGAQGIQGIQGIPGVKGDQGDPGKKGDPGSAADGYEIVTEEYSRPGGIGARILQGPANCPAGKVAIAGGLRASHSFTIFPPGFPPPPPVEVDHATVVALVRDDHPLDDGTGWFASADVNPDGTRSETIHLLVYAVCVNG